MKALLRCFFFIGFIAIGQYTAYAQLRPQFSMTPDYDAYINAARTGHDGNLSAVLAHRSLYTGIAGRAVFSQYAGFDMPLFSSKMGVGLQVLNDRIGYQGFTSVLVNSAYHLSLGKHKLSFGAGLGFTRMNLQGDRLRTPEGEYMGGVNHNDLVIPEEGVAGIAPVADVGVLFQIADHTEVGISVHNITNLPFSFSSAGNETNLFAGRTIYMQVQHVLTINSNWKMQLSGLYKTDVSQHQAELQARALVRKIWFGLGYRGYNNTSNEAVIGMLGALIKDRVDLGYSYDLGTSSLRSVNAGSHELRIRYVLPLKTNVNKPVRVFDPRYL